MITSYLSHEMMSGNLLDITESYFTALRGDLREQKDFIDEVLTVLKPYYTEHIRVEVWHGQLTFTVEEHDLPDVVTLPMLTELGDTITATWRRYGYTSKLNPINFNHGGYMGSTSTPTLSYRARLYFPGRECSPFLLGVHFTFPIGRHPHFTTHYHDYNHSTLLWEIKPKANRV